MFATPFSLPPNHTQTSQYSYRPAPLVNVGVQASTETLACGEHDSAQNRGRECSGQGHPRGQKAEAPDVRRRRTEKRNVVCPHSGHHSALKRGEAEETQPQWGPRSGRCEEARPGGHAAQGSVYRLSLHADPAPRHVLKCICNPKIDPSQPLADVPSPWQLALPTDAPRSYTSAPSTVCLVPLPLLLL